MMNDDNKSIVIIGILFMIGAFLFYASLIVSILFAIKWIFHL